MIAQREHPGRAIGRSDSRHERRLTVFRLLPCNGRGGLRSGLLLRPFFWHFVRPAR